MSEAVRAVALAEANKIVISINGTAEDVISTANQFLAFMQAGAGAPPKTSAAGTEPTPVKETKPAETAAATAKAAKAAAAVKAAAAKEAAAAAEALKKANAEAEADGEESDEPTGPFDGTPEGVAQVVSALIKGGKRDGAIALLKKYKAASVSGVQALGDVKVAAFVKEANTLLGFEGEPDIEA